MRFSALALAFFCFQQHALTTKALYFSEYVEGSSNNKAIEICNPGGSVDLGSGLYRLEVYNNGATTPNAIIPLSGVLAAGGAFVIADDNAVAAITGVANLLPTNSLWNGNDAIVLRDGGGFVVDSFGQVGSTDIFAEDVTFRRRLGICQGDTNPNDPIDLSEWVAFPQNTFDGLGACATTCSILFFSEYVEGTGLNKGIELCNPSVNDADISSYTLEVYNSGQTTPNAVIPLSGIVPASDTFVIADDGADPGSPLSGADLTTTSSLWNGDDAIVLKDGSGNVVDSFGQVGSTAIFASEVTFRRKSGSCREDTNPNDPIDLTEWVAFPQDTFDGLGTCDITCGVCPTDAPTMSPTNAPTKAPTDSPTSSPTKAPTDAPTKAPTDAPTKAPTDAPTKAPTDSPTSSPTKSPTDAPTKSPTDSPTTSCPALYWEDNFCDFGNWRDMKKTNSGGYELDSGNNDSGVRQKNDASKTCNDESAQTIVDPTQNPPQGTFPSVSSDPCDSCSIQVRGQNNKLPSEAIPLGGCINTVEVYFEFEIENFESLDKFFFDYTFDRSNGWAAGTRYTYENLSNNVSYKSSIAINTAGENELWVRFFNENDNYGDNLYVGKVVIQG